MQFTKPFKQRIAAGEITLSLRQWKSPQAKVGGQYNIVPFGAIEVTSVTTTTLTEVSNDDIAACGFDSIDALSTFLNKPDRKQDSLYRVEFRYLGSQRVNQPDRTQLAGQELQQLHNKLERMDRGTVWTHKAMQLIDQHPGTRAGDLAPLLNLETPLFKRQIRKLKALGLTESLEVGYRLTGRGRQILQFVAQTKDTQQ